MSVRIYAYNQLNEVLDDTPVYVSVGGARSKKGRREGTLEYSDVHSELMVKSSDTLQSIQHFVEAQLGPKDRLLSLACAFSFSSLISHSPSSLSLVLSCSFSVWLYALCSLSLLLRCVLSLLLSLSRIRSPSRARSLSLALSHLLARFPALPRAPPRSPALFLSLNPSYTCPPQYYSARGKARLQL